MLPLNSGQIGAGRCDPGDAAFFRTWGEAYGISVRTGAQDDFVGDRRQTWGGVARLGAHVAPGVNVGVSVDQSRTAIDARRGAVAPGNSWRRIQMVAAVRRLWRRGLH
jgi:hypothetical protein